MNGKPKRKPNLNDLERQESKYSVTHRLKLHISQCPICKNAKTADEFCEKTKLYTDQDYVGQEELVLENYKIENWTYKHWERDIEFDPPFSNDELYDRLLNERQGRILFLRIEEGMTFRQIAKELGLKTHATIERQYHDALKLIKKHFDKEIEKDPHYLRNLIKNSQYDPLRGFIHEIDDDDDN